MSDKKVADIVGSIEQRIEERLIELADHKYALNMSFTKEQANIIKAIKDAKRDLTIYYAIKQAKDINDATRPRFNNGWINTQFLDH